MIHLEQFRNRSRFSLFFFFEKFMGGKGYHRNTRKRKGKKKEDFDRG